MIIGYARVSTEDQNLALQHDALKLAGCEKVFEDKLSGAEESRPGLAQALAALRQGDTLVVWKLDRLARSLQHLKTLITEFEKDGIEFKSLKESIDTSTPTGRLIFHLFAALTEFERDIIRERTLAGIAAARKRGKHIGGVEKLDPKKQAMVRSLYSDPDGPSLSVICETMGISKRTLYRIVGKEQRRNAVV